MSVQLDCEFLRGSDGVMLTCLFIHAQKYLLQIKEQILMTSTVFVSVTGHLVVAGIYNYHLPLPILHSFGLQ